jgi:Flp pilus assembly protein TadD
MRKLLTSSAIVMLVLVSGCKNNPSSMTASTGSDTTTTSAQSSTPAASLSPEQLGTLGAQIKKQPNDAEKILADHGLNEQQFAAAVRKVSENPADAKRYATAYKSAS